MSCLDNICCICLKSGVGLQRLSDNCGEGDNEDYYTKLTKFMTDLVSYIFVILLKKKRYFYNQLLKFT